MRLNDKRLVVILERYTHMFDLNTMQQLAPIRTTQPLNKSGLGSLSSVNPETMASYFAFPHSDKGDSRGDVVVMNVLEFKQVSVIAAHRNPIVQLELCSDGTKLATCSTKGTNIKVFKVPSAQLLCTFRRGHKEALIYSISMNHNGSLLAASSDSGTLHVFNCQEGRYTLDPQGIRSFAKIVIPEKKETICCLASTNEEEAFLSVVTIPPAGHSGVVVQYLIESGGAKLAGEQRFAEK